MAKLHITIGPPLPDPSSFQNYTLLLNDEERTVLSLRGFACAASMLLPAYHLFSAAIEVGKKEAARRGYPSLIFQTFMRESMLDQLLVQIRRLYDPDPHSLGGGLLASLLARPEIRRAHLKSRKKGKFPGKIRNSVMKNLKLPTKGQARSPCQHPCGKPIALI